ncbi:YdcF family protein [Nanoarchaeota archaeon]
MSSYKNILIVLGAGPKKDGRPSNFMIARVRKAIQLYRKNNYSKVIITGGPTTIAVPESEVMRIMMLKFIPDSKIITERKSKTTIQNAVFTWEIIKDRKPKKITVVTSQHHVYRARHVFRKLYGHMNTSLKFEGAQDPFDPIEAVYYKIKELLLLVKFELFRS